MSGDGLTENAMLIVMPKNDHADRRGGQRRSRTADRKAFQNGAPALRRPGNRGFALNPGTQSFRRRKRQPVTGKDAASLLRRGELGAAARAAFGVSLDFVRVTRVELAVDQGLHQQGGFIAFHDAFSSASHASRSNERARASRDITVPIGAPTTSAISR